MPHHRIIWYERREFWVHQPCSCSTGERCDCVNGYWGEEYIKREEFDFYDWPPPNPGWRPHYQWRPAPPEHVPRRFR